MEVPLGLSLAWAFTGLPKRASRGISGVAAGDVMVRRAPARAAIQRTYMSVHQRGYSTFERLGWWGSFRPWCGAGRLAGRDRQTERAGAPRVSRRARVIARATRPR